MSHGSNNQSVNSDDANASGNALPDLAYVNQLFSAVDALHGVSADAANDSSVTADEVVVSQTAGPMADESGALSEVANHEVTSDASECAQAQTQGTESDAMSESNNSGVIALPGQCLLRDAVEMKSALLERADSNELNIDISAVERVDAAFMQLLIALTKQRASSGKAPLHYLGVSAALHAAAQVLGLSAQLKLPEAAA